MEELLVILIVEDDQQIQNVVEEALTDPGFEPAIVASGEQAVTLSQNYLPGTCDRRQPTGNDGRMGGREAGQRDRSDLPGRLHDRRGRRSMGRERRTEQHLADQAICTRAACHCPISTSQRR